MSRVFMSSQGRVFTSRVFTNCCGDPLSKFARRASPRHRPARHLSRPRGRMLSVGGQRLSYDKRHVSYMRMKGRTKLEARRTAGRGVDCRGPARPRACLRQSLPILERTEFAKNCPSSSICTPRTRRFRFMDPSIVNSAPDSRTARAAARYKATASWTCPRKHPHDLRPCIMS